MENKNENKMVLHRLLLFFCVFFSAKTEGAEMVFQGPIQCKIGNKKKLYLLPFSILSLPEAYWKQTRGSLCLKTAPCGDLCQWVAGEGRGGREEGRAKEWKVLAVLPVSQPAH